VASYAVTFDQHPIQSVNYTVQVLQSNQFFTPDTFTDIRAADTDRQRDVWQIKETSAKILRRRVEERCN